MKPVFFEQPARLFLALLCALFFLQTANAVAIKSKQSGNWTSPSTWEGGVVPTDQDDVVVKLGHTVTRSTAFFCQGYLYVYGTMVYTGNVTREFSVATSLEIDGAMRVEGGSLFAGGIVYGDGLFKQTAGSTTFYKAVVLQFTEILGGTVIYQNINNGNLILDNLTLKNAEMKVFGTENLHVTLSMSWQHNGKVAGSLSIDEGATLTFAPGNNSFYHQGYLYNNGVTVIGAGTLTNYVNASRVYNYGLWKFDVQANATSNASNLSFYNFAQVLKSGPGGASISSFLSYSGSLLHVQQNGMTIKPSIDIHDGIWQVDPGCSLLVSTNNSVYAKFGGPKVINKGTVYGRISFTGVGATFLEGDGKYEYMEIDKPGPFVSLSGSPEVTQAFTLSSGRIVLNQYDLRLGTANLSYTSDFSSYIETNGTGSCVRNCKAGDFVVYPIGKGDFAPMIVSMKAGSVQDNIKARVADSFYGEFNGVTPTCSEEVPIGVVAHHWVVAEQTPGGSLADLVAYWYPAAERNGFDRSNCTLGHYVGGNWEPYDFGNAIDAPPLYAAFNKDLTSFGLFGVFDAGHEGDVNFKTPAPEANTPVCEWNDLQLHANTSPNADIQWSGPNGFQSTDANPMVPGIQLSQGGIYNVTAEQYGCPQKQASLTVQVNAEPDPFVQGPDHIQLGETASLLAYGGVSFAWSTGDTAQTIVVAPVQTTDYVVTVTNPSGCTATALHTVQVTGTSAIQETDGSLDALTLAPNPASDVTRLRFESGVSGEALVSLFDARGVLLMQKTISVETGANQTDISLKDIPAGTYQLTLMREREVKTIRLVRLNNE